MPVGWLLTVLRLVVHRRQLGLHIAAAVALALPVVQVHLALTAMGRGIVRQVVSSPELALVAALKGQSEEIAALKVAHAEAFWEPWALHAPNMAPVSWGLAILFEVYAWRRRRAGSSGNRLTTSGATQ